MRQGATVRILRALAAVAVAVVLSGFDARAQFKSEAFSQSYNEDQSQPGDTIDKVFSFKEFWSGLTHKYEEPPKLGTMFAGSFVFIGSQQIYNRDYWKLPIIYGGIGAGVGLGIHYNSIGNHNAATWCFVGAGLTYWASLMDGVACYKTDIKPHAGRATAYSVLLPGLGQAYNGEYWKIPIYVGGLAAAGHFCALFNTQFVRFRNIYIESVNEGYDGPITSEVAKYYRDLYRRYRDYSIVAIAAVYLLQIIDANVFSYMHDFNVNDNLAMTVSPAVIPVDCQYASANSSVNNAAVGMNLSFRF